MALRSICVGHFDFGASELEFLTLLEVIETGIIYSNKSRRRPTRYIPVTSNFNRSKMGVKIMPLLSVPMCLIPILALRGGNL